MLNKLIENKPKIHTRDIQLATYPLTDSSVIVHGILKDRRTIHVFDVTGEIKGPGIIHHMDVKLLIKSHPLIIEKAEAQMMHVPMPECRSTLDTLEKLNGVEVKSGFSKKIRRIMGGKSGCTHLCQLVIVMGQEIVHGWLTQKRKNKPSIPENLEMFSEKNFLIDSCRLWSADGPKIQLLKEAIKNRRNR